MPLAASSSPRVTPALLGHAAGRRRHHGPGPGRAPCAGLFLLPVSMDRGWSRETFAMAMALQNLTWGVAQPFTGMIADRHGSAKVIAAGLVFYALGLIGMTLAATPAMFVLTAGICVGIALSGTAFAVIYGALSRLVAPERRSWALAVAGAVGGLGQFTLVPAAQWLISGAGWTRALSVFAVALAVALPLALILREARRPRPASARRSATSRWGRRSAKPSRSAASGC